jgi:hypothetical protein
METRVHVEEIFPFHQALVIVADVRAADSVDRAHRRRQRRCHFLGLVDEAQGHGIRRGQLLIGGERTLPQLPTRGGRGRRLQAGVFGARLVGVAADLVEKGNGIPLPVPVGQAVARFRSKIERNSLLVDGAIGFDADHTHQLIDGELVRVLMFAAVCEAATALTGRCTSPCRTDYIITSSQTRAGGFGPLGPTPFPDSR